MKLERAIKHQSLWLSTVLLGIACATSAAFVQANNSQLATQPQSALTVSTMAGLQMPFVENAGQTDASVGFYAQTFAGTTYVTRAGELVYSLLAKDGKPGWTLVERFARGTLHPVGKDTNISPVSYIKNQEGKAMSQNAATFGKLDLGEVFTGIRVELVAHGDSVEKVYIVSPGAHTNAIRMTLVGVNGLSKDAEGALLAQTGNGSVRFSTPVAWQEQNGAKTPVKVSYTIDKNGYGFELGDYDHSRSVMIDPLLQATYLGGNSRDRAKSIAVSPQTGDVYMVGYTTAPGSGFSNNFPGTAGGYQANQGKVSMTLFLARLTADLKGLAQTTYFNPPAVYPDNADLTYVSLKIHPHNGDAYVFYPTDPKQYATNPMPGGLAGAVSCGKSEYDKVSSPYAVTRFSADLKQLLQSTCLPILQNSKVFKIPPSFEPERVAIHPVTGDLYFGGAGDLYFGGAQDAAIVRIAADLKSHVDHTTFGSSKEDEIQGITIHPTTGDVYVTGTTQFNDFPNTEDSFQPNNASQVATGMKADAFVAYLSEDLDTLKRSTYLGGVLADYGHQIIIGSGNDHSVYVLSETENSDFPAVAGGAVTDPIPSSKFNVTNEVLSKLSSDLTQIHQSSFVQLKTNLMMSVPDILLLQSPVDANLLCLPIHPLGIGSHTVAKRFSPDLKTLNGSVELYPNSALQLVIKDYAISPVNGDLYLAGYEYDQKSTFIHPNTQGGYQSSSSLAIGGKEDSFIARYTLDGIGGAAIKADLEILQSSTPNPVKIGSQLTITLIVKNKGPDEAHTVKVTDVLPANTTFSSASAPCSYSGTTVTCDAGTLANGASKSFTSVITPTVAGGFSNTANVSGQETDPTPTNNSVIQSVAVRPYPQRPAALHLPRVLAIMPYPMLIWALVVK